MFAGKKYFGLILITVFFWPSVLFSYNGKLNVVTTIFPVYSLAKAVGGDKVDVTMLMPPGTSAHHFEPTPGDVMLVTNADVFIFSIEMMEPWVIPFVAGINNPKLRVINAGRYAKMYNKEDLCGKNCPPNMFADEKKYAREHDDSSVLLDPHIWLDFYNVDRMAKYIAEEFIEADRKNFSYYLTKYTKFKQALNDLARRYRVGLSDCENKNFVYIGHFAFGYMAYKYGLNYVTLPNFPEEGSPSPRQIIDLVKMIKKYKVNTVFAEGSLSPDLATTIKNETGVAILPLTTAATLYKSDMDRGMGLIAVMDRNLKNLMRGMGCQTK
jgi:zinc transport system substrate-binding protein